MTIIIFFFNLFLSSIRQRKVSLTQGLLSVEPFLGGICVSEEYLIEIVIFSFSSLNVYGTVMKSSSWKTNLASEKTGKRLMLSLLYVRPLNQRKSHYTYA